MVKSRDAIWRRAGFDYRLSESRGDNSELMIMGGDAISASACNRCLHVMGLFDCTQALADDYNRWQFDHVCSGGDLFCRQHVGAMQNDAGYCCCAKCADGCQGHAFDVLDDVHDNSFVNLVSKVFAIHALCRINLRVQHQSWLPHSTSWSLPVLPSTIRPFPRHSCAWR